mgnify:CR=1 FL=1
MRKNSQHDITFLFGAGAETKFGLPLGAEYTNKTILCKRNKMYAALAEFYKAKNVNGYQKEFMFAKDSTTFFKIIELAIGHCNDLEEMDYYTKSLYEKFIQYKEQNNCNDFKQYVKNNVYEKIITDIDDKNKDDNSNYEQLRKNLDYYGSIEKDFSVIINRERAGTKRFWRLINYFWSCYFSIIIPLLDIIGEKSFDGENIYKSVLNNLYKVSKRLIDIENGDDKKFDLDDNKNYYKMLHKKFSDSYALTTNYTPFVAHYWGKKSSYLAGKLSEFEIPDELDVCTYEEKNMFDNKLIFPFLATQAPVKPIIHSCQLKEYVSALNVLDSTKTLIIVGYNINENDNHINAILRNYVKNRKRLIFCKYEDNSNCFDENIELQRVLKNLKLQDNHEDSYISIIQNAGNVNQLTKELDVMINGNNK